MARHLAAVPDLTVITNSVPMADVLHTINSTGLTVVVTGGQRTPSDALVGPVAIHTLANLHLDVVLLGSHGVDKQVGLTTPNLAEAETNRAFIHSAARLIVLADHTKFGVVALSEFANLSEVSSLVTDGARAIQSWGDVVGEIVVAPRANPTAVPSKKAAKDGS